MIRVQESDQALLVDPRIAVANELDRHGVNAHLARLLTRGESRQLAVVAPRQVLVDFQDRCLEDVEVVEQPLGGSRALFAARRVVAERDVDLSQRAHVRVEASQVSCGRPPPGIYRQQRCQTAGVVFERFDTKQFEPGVGRRADMRELIRSASHASAQTGRIAES